MEPFLRAQYRPMYALCRRLLRDPGLAEEACQEGFTRFWSMHQSGRTITNPPGYLYQTCLNSALQLMRMRRRAPASLSQDVAAKGDSPDRQALLAGIRESAVAAVAELPPRQGEVFTARMLQGLSTQETAEMLGCSVETVRANLCYALRAVKEHVRRRDSGAGGLS
jgi:RNA polymerase sigma-70 factor, ECF subfamily